MVSIVGVIILLIVIIVGWSLFSTEINAFITDTKGVIRNADTSIPKADPGTPVYDLSITVKPKIKVTNVGIGVDYILFLNEQGGTVDWKWINPHLQPNALLTLLPLSLGDYFNAQNSLGVIQDLETNEIIIPTSNAFASKFKLSYVLVDPNTGLKRALPQYQDIEYRVPELVKDYTVEEKIVIKDIPKQQYELWIIPEKVGTFTTRFADSAVGESYKQVITP